MLGSIETTNDLDVIFKLNHGRREERKGAFLSVVFKEANVGISHK